MNIVYSKSAQYYIRFILTIILPSKIFICIQS